MTREIETAWPLLFVPSLSSEPPSLKFKVVSASGLPLVSPAEPASALSSRSGCPGPIVSSTYLH